MKTFTSLVLLCAFPLLNLLSQEAAEQTQRNWPTWRGPNDNGIAALGNPPLNWSEDLNIKWKTPIPGTGHATPIVWGKQIILLSAVPTDRKVEEGDAGEGDDWMNPVSTNMVHRFVVISVDRESGEILWETTLREELPHSHTHEFGSWASSSPLTDGKRIYAYFGSHGLYCLDLEGNVLWEKDFGIMNKRRSFGEGSSPILSGNRLIVLRDHEGESMLHVMDKRSGEIIWETVREEPTSWSTPVVLEYNGVKQLICSASKRVRAYNLEDGSAIWECGGLTLNVIPQPVFDEGILYVMSGFRGNALMAIDLARASGDITDTDAIIWSHDSYTSYTPSPVLTGGCLYFLRTNNGFLSCLDAADGTVHYEAVKLEGIGNIFTSPVAVADRLYIIGSKGTACVVRQGKTFELISANTLDDNFYASPVILGDELLLRGEKSLYCIAED